MALALVLVSWMLCGVWGYRLAKNWWLRSYDYTRSDRTFFLVLIIFGPANLGAMWLIVGIDWIDQRGRGQEVLVRRGGH